MSIRSSLAPHVARTPTGEDHLDAMRRAAWHGQGIVMINPDQIENTHPWLAQAARSFAIEQYGAKK